MERSNEIAERASEFAFSHRDRAKGRCFNDVCTGMAKGMGSAKGSAKSRQLIVCEDETRKGGQKIIKLRGCYFSLAPKEGKQSTVIALAAAAAAD